MSQAYAHDDDNTWYIEMDSVDRSLYAILIGTMIASGFVVLAAASALVHVWRPLPSVVFKAEGLLGAIIVLLLAGQFLSLRLASPDIHVRMAVPVVVLLCGAAVAISALLGFRGSRLGMVIIGISALAPLAMSVVRFIDD